MYIYTHSTHTHTDISKNGGQKKGLDHYRQSSVYQLHPLCRPLGAPHQLCQGLDDDAPTEASKGPTQAGRLCYHCLAVAASFNLGVLDTGL